MSSTTEQSHPSDIPFDSPDRTTPIHPSLPAFRVTTTNPSQGPHLINPLTNQPFTTSELESLNLKDLLEEHYRQSVSGDPESKPAEESAAKARDEAIEELKRHLELQERKKLEVEAEMKEAENTRKLERKIFENMKKKGDDAL